MYKLNELMYKILISNINNNLLNEKENKENIKNHKNKKFGTNNYIKLIDNLKYLNITLNSLFKLLYPYNIIYFKI